MSSTQKTIAIVAAIILIAWYFSKRKAAKKEAPKKPINRADVPTKESLMGSSPTWEAPVLPPPPAQNYARKPQTVSIKPQGEALINCDPKYFVEINGQCVWRFALPGTTANPIPPMPI